MSNIQEYITLEKLKVKFAQSELLPILERIFNFTKGLTITVNINLSREETSVLLDACNLKEFLNFDPALALMTCLGMFFPQNNQASSNTAFNKFKRHTGLEIVVTISSGIAIIFIKKV